MAVVRHARLYAPRSKPLLCKRPNRTRGSTCTTLVHSGNSIHPALVYRVRWSLSVAVISTRFDFNCYPVTPGHPYNRSDSQPLYRQGGHYF